MSHISKKFYNACASYYGLTYILLFYVDHPQGSYKRIITHNLCNQATYYFTQSEHVAVIKHLVSTVMSSYAHYLPCKTDDLLYMAFHITCRQSV